MSITALTPAAPTIDTDSAAEADPAVVLAAYARQVDELARLVEDWQGACAGYARILTDSLGELHVVLDETANSMNRQGGRR